MEEKGEVLYELGPKFDFIYELTMPTGRKMKSSFVATIISMIICIILFVFNSQVAKTQNDGIMNIYNICKIVSVVIVIFTALMFASKVIIQILEYKGIKYKFYKDCLVFENNFLNQTRKTIEYSNIREVEIRRTIIDRIMNYGVIIIYTNADKAYGSATVLYAIKNTEEHYNNIESLIHNGNIISGPIKTGKSLDDLREETNLKRAMDKREEYTEYSALSDKNPLNKE